MKNSFILKLAFKNLWFHRLRSMITVLGVTIGIGSIIFLVSLGYGLERLVTNQIANFDAFTVIDVPAANIKTIKIDQDTIDRISKFPHIKTVAPVSNIAGRIRKQNSSSSTETVIVGGNEQYWNLAEGRPDIGHMPLQQDEIVVNTTALNLMGETTETAIDKQINLDMIITPELRTNQADGTKVANDVPLKIVGVMTDGKSPMVYVSLNLLAANDATQFSSLKVKVDNRNYVAGIRKQIENIGLSTEYVGDTVSEISQFFSFFRAILAAFGLIALVVAALGMFNTLTISLLERIREVGLLKALGMKNRDVYRVFLTESLIIGVGGGILGLMIGLFLGKGIDFALSILAARAGTDQIELFVTPWFFALAVSLFSIIVGFVTGWYPARRAVKINPLDALRFE